jgi:hypothetical protein
MGLAGALAPRANSEDGMVYCVIPPALAEELYDKLTEYYKDDPGVEVIVDRRKAERRERGSSGGGKRMIRDRRRRRPGMFPLLELD